MTPYPRGKVTDYGDLLHVEQWIVKGLRRLHIVLRVGAPFDTTEADRVSHGTPIILNGKADLIMDLQADKQVPLSVQWTDEVGNPVDAPAESTVTYSVDDPALINLTDNGDGTAVAAAVGALGEAMVHVEAVSDGATFTGDLSIVVVAGLAERLNVVAGEPEEVTPDL